MADISWKLTCSLSFDLLGRNRQNGEHLSYDLHEYLRHFCSQGDLGINSKPLEEALDTLKQFEERIVARADIFCRLCNIDVKGSANSC